MSIGHEIFHFYFHKFYFEELEKKIGKEKTTDFKEALTVLLNLEFNDLFLIEDKGYENHKDLREFIKEKWSKRKSFDFLIYKFLESNS
ncbi:MAG: hypothetical protein QW103_01330 [Candidatus Pacearchaeota archaeon]